MVKRAVKGTFYRKLSYIKKVKDHKNFKKMVCKLKKIVFLLKKRQNDVYNV